VIDASVARIPWTRESAAISLHTVATRLAGDALAVATRVRQAWCGLGGHEMIRRFEPGRVSLQCLSCGGQTRGWTVQVASSK
jgi:hypothetical protein